jgi:hypothetical protein
MGRPTRLGLVILAVLLVIAGAHAVYWYIVAGQIEDGVVAWAQSARADKVDVSWHKIHVTGFPIAFRVELETATLRDGAVTPSPEFHIPSISGTAGPWDFADWRLAVPQGFTADIAGAGERAPVKLTAQTAKGTVSIGPEDGWSAWLRLQDAAVEAGARVRVSMTDAWVTLPPKPPRGHTDPKLALAVNARQVELPVAIGPFGETIAELDFGATVKGAIPNGKLREVVAAWRDAGGTIELDKLRLKWGALGATATGTMALDPELQPIGALSGAIQGYDQILTALVEGGRMRATDAGLARIALSLLARPGPDGKPEIKTGFTIQNGQMYLGPAKLGKAPHLTWE